MRILVLSLSRSASLCVCLSLSVCLSITTNITHSLSSIADGILQREEFCSALEQSMRVRKTSELKGLTLDESVKEKIMRFVCKFRDKFARFLDEEKLDCRVDQEDDEEDNGNDATAKAKTNVNTTTTTAVQLVKRSDKTVLTAIGTINVLFAAVFLIQGISVFAGAVAFVSMNVLLGSLFLTIAALLFYLGGTQLAQVTQLSNAARITSS